ncbi:hypothetical protein [Reinekea sp. G2M2-21]|uniref:hypothetical protein n=1 Tax=Reinekea sp. G2M2-21 TaxID=2788942 RepID=UPI0018ABBDE0|nr:hypothetical protein [Reinekea sp. G2M2-21]
MSRDPVSLRSAFPNPQFSVLTGHAEMAVSEAVESRVSRPRKVTAILAATISHLDNEPVSEESFRRLSSAGREWLLHRSASQFYRGDWFEARCPSCQAVFDLNVSFGDLPHSTPHADFPIFKVETSLGWRHFEAPNGLFEERIAQERGTDPRREFARLCGLSIAADSEATQYTDHDLQRIDDALEAQAPDIADAVRSTCPECKAEHDIRIDPLAFAFPTWHELIQEVHSLAHHYHWQEHDILALPQRRRKQYAQLIRRSTPRGVYQ